jgi:lipoprotein-releasing system permease protein
MYKLLLCWRYLRTRYIALVCIISVTLGVATMVVVNAVMAGFTRKMDGEMTSMIGDLILQVHSIDGVADAPWHMKRIREAAGDSIACMSPSAAVPALIYMEVNGNVVTKPVMLVGIDDKTYASVSNLGKFLQHPDNRKQLQFLLRPSGYDAKNENLDHDAPQPGTALKLAGWEYRMAKAEQLRAIKAHQERMRATAPAASGAAPPAGQNPFDAASAAQGKSESAAAEPQGRDFDPARDVHPGIILAIGDCSTRLADGATWFYNRPGDDVRISIPKATPPPEPINSFYTVVDVYTVPVPIDNMSMAFVPLEYLQRSRGMIDPTSGIGKFTSIQIKLKPDADATAVRDKLRKAFDPNLYEVTSWQDNQAALLHAIRTETTLLNVLLFMIVAVAGFGILAIFYMIVVEKTRDIGILKSLGASARGVMGIFLAYGLSLGIVGAGAGVALGILFAAHINEIKDVVERINGQPLFDSSIYFFYKIPTIIEPLTVAWIAGGAIGIAVLASVLPARRAARLHPVQALRYE